MKKHTTALALLMVLALSHCKTKQATTVPAPAAFEPSDQQVEMAGKRWAGTQADELKQGYHIYTTRCNQCHSLFEIPRFTEKKWLHEIDEMAPKAKLSPEEKEKLTKHILSYLDASTAAGKN